MHMNVFDISIYVAESFESLEYNLRIDALSLVSLNVSSADLHAILVESICRNIRLIEMQHENQQPKYHEDTKLFLKSCEIMHFKPQSCGHLLTIVYPNNSSNIDTGKICLVCTCLSLIMISNKLIYFYSLCIIFTTNFINFLKHH